jgi:outer membrane lipoprotein SlyB
VRLEAARNAGLLEPTKGKPVKFSVVKRFAPAVLGLGIAASGVGLTAGTAFASSSMAAKAGAACSKADKGKTEKAGKVELVCKDVKGKYKWEKK